MPSTHVEPSADQHVDPGAETPVVPSPEMDKSTPLNTQKKQSPFFRYDVDFDVTNCTDAAQLLSEFLRALIKMDKDSSILLSKSTSEDQKLDATTLFPAATSKDSSRLMAFVKRYILGLRRIGTSSLKGIIRVYTHFKFRSPPASEMSDPPSSFASPPEADPDDVTYVLSPPRRLRRSTKAPAHTPPSAYGSSRSSKRRPGGTLRRLPIATQLWIPLPKRMRTI
jgi:hypothetical protein